MKYCIIDIKYSFTENSKRHQKYVEASEIIETLNKRELIHTYSRYEVLNKRIRRVYFDIEKIPKENTTLINDIIDSLKKFYCEKLGITEIEHVITYNYGSKTHEGLSYHVIFPKIAVDYSKQKLGVCEFVETEEGKKYKEYIDTSIYSSSRLFKLPYYIGIVNDELDEDHNNYHRFDSGVDARNFIIQDIENSQVYYPDFKPSLDSLRTAVKVSPDGVVRQNFMQRKQIIIPMTAPKSQETQKFTLKWCLEK